MHGKRLRGNIPQYKLLMATQRGSVTSKITQLNSCRAELVSQLNSTFIVLGLCVFGSTPPNKNYAIAAVPNIFGARDQRSYENLTPNDLRWS